MRALRVATFLLAPTGCILVIEGTDGYTSDPARPSASAARDAAAGGGLELGCLSTNDCREGGADAVCCVSITSTSAATTSCQAGPCGGSIPIQLCATEGECAGVPCTLQTCVVGGAPVTLRACGTVPTCTAR